MTQLASRPGELGAGARQRAGHRRPCRLIVIADVPAAKPRTYRLQIGAIAGGRAGVVFTPLPGAQLASELFSYPAW